MISLQLGFGSVPYSHSWPTTGHLPPGAGGCEGQALPPLPPLLLPLEPPLLVLDPPLLVLDPPLLPPEDPPLLVLEPPLLPPEEPPLLVLEPPLLPPLDPPLDEPLLDAPLELPELEPLPPSAPPSVSIVLNVVPPHAHAAATAAIASTFARMSASCRGRLSATRMPAQIPSNLARLARGPLCRPGQPRHAPGTFAGGA